VSPITQLQRCQFRSRLHSDFDPLGDGERASRRWLIAVLLGMVAMSLAAVAAWILAGATRSVRALPGLLEGTQGQQRGALGGGHAGGARDVQALVAALGEQCAHTGASAGLPQPHRPVVAAAEDELAVGGQRHAQYRVAWATREPDN
jgi:hypothetical protein